MTSSQLEMNSPAWLRTISWKTIATWIAIAIFASTASHAEMPVEVPNTTAALLAQERHREMYWAALRLLSLAIPLLILFTGLGARLRRRCDDLCGQRWFWTATLFACCYLVLAAPIEIPFDFYAGYVQPHAA